MKRRGSPSPDPPYTPPICKTEDCIKHDINSSCVSNECKCNTDYIGTYPNCNYSIFNYSFYEKKRFSIS